MSKRIQIKIESVESLGLLALRKQSGLSIRKLADRLNISPARVHQMESGREDVSKEYIEKFLTVLELNWNDWDFETSKGKKKSNPLKDKCHELIDLLPPSKLEKVFFFLGAL